MNLKLFKSLIKWYKVTILNTYKVFNLFKRVLNYCFSIFLINNWLKKKWNEIFNYEGLNNL